MGYNLNYETHMHEYTKREVEELLEKHGFRVLKTWHSEINDPTFVNAEFEEYLNLNSYQDLIALAIRKPTKLNTLRALAYPIVTAVPSMRMLIVA